MRSMIIKSVKSINQCKSLPCRQAGVILTSYDIVKAHGGEIRVETEDGQGSEFIIHLPIV